MPKSETNSIEQSGHLRLTTFGELGLWHSGTDLVSGLVLSPGKLLALIVYLACSPQRTASRDHVLNMLWADIEPRAARHALRQALWYLRRQFGPDVVATRDSDLILTELVTSDREEFLDAVDRRDLEHAVTLYRGEFLAGIAVPGGAEFEQWVDIERSRLSRIFARAAETLVRDWISAGKTGPAVRLARQVRDVSPSSQSAWRLVLETLHAADDAVTGVAEAHAFADLLENERRQPDPASLRLIELICSPDPDSPTNNETNESGGEPRLWAELVGREREFGTIVRAWDNAKEGSGSLLAIVAPAGMGKSRLLNDVANRFRTIAARVVQLRANPGDRRIAYTFGAAHAGRLCDLPGAVAIAPQCASTLVALNPSLSSRFNANPESVGERDVLRRRTISLTELLTAVTHEHPIVLLIDDLHWSDDESLTLLASLSGIVRELPVLMVTATRPTPRVSVPETAGIEMTLPPLTEEHIAAIVNGMASLPDAAWSSRLPAQLLSATHGSPLLVIETLQLAVERGHLELSEHGWTCGDVDSLSSALQAGSALRRRVNELGRNEGWLLLLLAVSGSPIPLERIGVLGGMGETALQQALATLERRGFANHHGSRYQVAHDEIGTAAVEIASGEALIAANNALGQVLFDDNSNDLHTLTLAGQFLARAGDKSRLRNTFKRCVWLARQRGDTRRLDDIATQLLGPGAGSGEVARLVRGLPLFMRIGLTSARRVVAVTAGFLVSTAAVLWAILAPAAEPPDVILTVVAESNHGSTAAYEVPIRRRGWDPREPIDVAAVGVEVPALKWHGSAQELVPLPGRGEWVVGRLSSDSGGLDLYLVEDGGESRRLTYAAGDDVNPSWSPDGDHLVFQTCRWNHFCKYDLAVLDMTKGDVRAFMRDETTFSMPRWSPDGTRIAYRTGESAKQTREVCWTSIDRTIHRCHVLRDPAARISRLEWHGPNALLILINNRDRRQLVLLDLRSEQFSDVNTPVRNGPTQLTVSPDASWFALHQPAIEEVGGAHWIVYPFGQPELARKVEYARSNRYLKLSFRERPGETPPFL